MGGGGGGGRDKILSGFSSGSGGDVTAASSEGGPFERTGVGDFGYCGETFWGSDGVSGCNVGRNEIEGEAGDDEVASSPLRVP